MNDPHVECPCCHRRGTVVRPSRAWMLALAMAYAAFAVMIFGAGLLGPTIMVVLPLLAAYGLGVLPYVHARASAPTVCVACDRIVSAERSRPAHVAMMGAAARA